MRLDEEPQEYDDEIDDAFLNRYKPGRTTITQRVGQASKLDLQSNTTSTEEMLRAYKEGMLPSHLLNILHKRIAENTMAERKKAIRRAYEAKRRAGLIPPGCAKPFVRKGYNKDKQDLRKKLSYYLPVSVYNAVQSKVKTGGLKRRDYCASCLEKFLDDFTKTDIKPLFSKGQQLIFVLDELDSDLWDKLKNFCHSSDPKLPMYQVVTAAYLKDLDILHEC